ncbi:adenosylcobinamide-phosphate synthase [Albidovulum inexpectatum]|uniref:Cobalamin biosynthesis protein CobD n=1 Tax=Albidovulum inexpectatum TaxID=196587 RepID=A0A2S5JDJ3_9RHOB|nr:adenosylcobinamide-phosphate synthase CbiB [Albidovulum inexpectatum]PPB79557.1 adenosylcobinamide-phosphate synthase [Albidovulum inexpectatum]
MSHAAAMLIAMLIDAAIGWPDRLFTRIGHPVTWIGRLIAWADGSVNRDADSPARRRLAGVATALSVIVVVWAAASGLQYVLPEGWAGIVLTGILAWPLVALRSMHDHVLAVARPLTAGDLPAARRAVSMIVGRDPNRLDAPAVARAAIESLAENTSDGIVAPVFWGLVFGLPGITVYKAINTMDSMIGHRSPRHEAFGWAAARIDDVANLVPARLTGLIFALTSARPRAALVTMLRDAPDHRSPNAGWPEAALAGALNIRLSGPRIYGDRVAPEPWVNGEAPDPTPADVMRALSAYHRAMLALAALIALIAAV